MGLGSSSRTLVLFSQQCGAALVVFVVGAQSNSVHNAHGTHIFQGSGATCISLMRLVVVRPLEMLV